MAVTGLNGFHPATAGLEKFALPGELRVPAKALEGDSQQDPAKPDVGPDEPLSRMDRARVALGVSARAGAAISGMRTGIDPFTASAAVDSAGIAMRAFKAKILTALGNPSVQRALWASGAASGASMPLPEVLNYR